MYLLTWIKNSPFWNNKNGKMAVQFSTFQISTFRILILYIPITIPILVRLLQHQFVSSSNRELRNVRFKFYFSLSSAARSQDATGSSVATGSFNFSIHKTTKETSPVHFYCLHELHARRSELPPTHNFRIRHDDSHRPHSVITISL